MTLLNPETGEVRIDAKGAGEQCHVLFTAEAWVQIEQTLKVSTLDLAQRCGAGTVSITEMCVLLMAGSRGWARRHGGQGELKQAQALRVVETVGLLSCISQVNDAIEHSHALGIDAILDEDRPEPTEGGGGPTNGTGSSSDASVPELAQWMPGG